MPPFERKYTATMMKAIYDAKFARALSYPRIAELAGTGELVAGQPFEISAYYVGEKCRAEQKRRRGKDPSALAKLAPKDSGEFMRVSLLNLWDSERLALEREKEGKRDLAKFDQLAKVALTIARLPGPKDDTPRNPATRDAEGNRGPELRGGLGGQLIKAMRDGEPRSNGTDTGEYTAEPSATPTSSSDHEQQQG